MKIHKFVPIDWPYKRDACKKCGLPHVHPCHAINFCYLQYIEIWHQGIKYAFTSWKAANKVGFFNS